MPLVCQQFKWSCELTCWQAPASAANLYLGAHQAAAFCCLPCIFFTVVAFLVIFAVIALLVYLSTVEYAQAVSAAVHCLGARWAMASHRVVVA